MSRDHITTVTHVSLDWIKANLQGSQDGYETCTECEVHTFACLCETSEFHSVDWYDMIESKRDDYDLQRKFKDGIKDPICLQYNDGKWIQGNGHHRLTYALLMNLESIPCVFSFDDDWMMEYVTDSEKTVF